MRRRKRSPKAARPPSGSTPATFSGQLGRSTGVGSGAGARGCATSGPRRHRGRRREAPGAGGRGVGCSASTAFGTAPRGTRAARPGEGRRRRQRRRARSGGRSLRKSGGGAVRSVSSPRGSRPAEKATRLRVLRLGCSDPCRVSGAQVSRGIELLLTGTEAGYSPIALPRPSPTTSSPRPKAPPSLPPHRVFSHYRRGGLPAHPPSRARRSRWGRKAGGEHVRRRGGPAP